MLNISTYAQRLFDILKIYFDLFIHKQEFYAKVIDVYDIIHIKVKHDFTCHTYKMAEIIEVHPNDLYVKWVIREMISYMKDRVFKFKLLEDNYVYIHDTFHNCYVNNWINNMIIHFSMNNNTT